MKILITGGSGLLGHDLARCLEGKHEVTTWEGRADVDVTDAAAVAGAIKRAAPEIIIHSAGWRDVDGCERDVVKAYAINSLGTRNVCLGAREVGAVVAYISSDSVFDGDLGRPYYEFDAPCPVNAYGRSKWAAEREVTSLLKDFFIFRVPLLFGVGPARRLKENTLAQAILSEQVGRSVTATDDQFSSPTFTYDIARALEVILPTRRFGVYHLSNTGTCSRAGLLRAGIEITGGDPRIVRSVSSSDLGRPALRQRYSPLDSVCVEPLFGLRFRRWHEALEDCVKSDAFRNLLSVGGCDGPDR